MAQREMSSSAGGEVLTEEGSDGRRRSKMMYGIAVVVAYGSTSLAITMVNKVVMSVYGFKYELSLLLAQLIVGTLAMKLLSSMGILSLPSLSASRLRVCMPLAICFFIYVITGLGSLRSLSLPTWAAMRRMTCLFILGLDWIEGKNAPTFIWLSVLLMLLGAVVAAYNDLEGTPIGYAQVWVNCIASAQYLREVGKVKRATGMNEVGTLYYTNMLCIPTVLLCMYATGEREQLSRFEHASDFGFQAWLAASALLAGLLNFLVFLSANVNSPLTTSVAGQVKNVAGSLSGYVLMPSAASGDVFHISGILIGLCASMWYAWMKYTGYK